MISLSPYRVAEIIVPEPVESREAVLHEEAPPVEAPQSSPAEQSSTEPEPYVLPGGMNLHYVLGLLVDDALAEIQRKQDDITAQLTKARTALAEVRAALKDFS